MLELLVEPPSPDPKLLPIPVGAEPTVLEVLPEIPKRVLVPVPLIPGVVPGGGVMAVPGVVPNALGVVRPGLVPDPVLPGTPLPVTPPRVEPLADPVEAAVPEVPPVPPGPVAPVALLPLAELFSVPVVPLVG